MPKRQIKITLLLALTVTISYSPVEAKTQRSPAAKSEFKRMNPCPATGDRRGMCPGFEIDHAIPLKCGGPDHYTNMQWLTVSDHKDKTRRESWMCRR